MTLKPRPRLLAARRPQSFKPQVQTLEARDLLSVFVVDRLTDAGEGDKLAGDFRYCLTQAADGDSITFGVEGTINLTRVLPDLTHSIAIEGPGADRLTVRRYAGGAYRIFTVTSAEVTISGLTVTGGIASSGGGILVNGGRLTVANSTIANNFATTDGGGLSVQSGTLAVSDSTIADNEALYAYTPLDSIRGGGLTVTGGVVVVRGSTLARNTAHGFPACGSGRCSRVVNGLGGGVYMSGGLLTIDGSTLSSNRAIGGNGGCTEHTKGTTCYPAASGMGGGLYIGGGSLTIRNSTLSSNSGSGGRIDSYDPYGMGGDGLGGGLYIGQGNIEIYNSTIALNEATGGDVPHGHAADGGNGVGGGLYNSGGTLILDDSTIAANSARGGLGDEFGKKKAGARAGAGSCVASGARHTTPS